MSFETPASEDFVFYCPVRLDCVLAAAEVGELEQLRSWCEQLPESSYGQVFISGERPLGFEQLTTPPGVAVNWVGCAAGEERRADTALASAVDAWLDEWVRVEHGSERSVRLWAGAREIPAMRDFWHRLEKELTAA